MKYMHIFGWVLFFWSSCLDLNAQELAATHAEQVAAMNKLKHLLGEWKGSGWIEMGERRFEFESSEIFSEKAGGLAIMVEGLHQMPLPTGEKRVVHNAVAMITYDAESDRYRFISQLANGRGGQYWGIVTDEGAFKWTIPETPMGKITYMITAGDGEYNEIGEVTLPSGESQKFFEMTLKRATQ